MTCQECLSLLDKFVSEVTVAETAAAIKHLDNCPSCTESYDKLCEFDKSPPTMQEILAANYMKQKMMDDPEAG